MVTVYFHIHVPGWSKGCVSHQIIFKQKYFFYIISKFTKFTHTKNKFESKYFNISRQLLAFLKWRLKILLLKTVFFQVLKSSIFFSHRARHLPICIAGNLILISRGCKETGQKQPQKASPLYNPGNSDSIGNRVNCCSYLCYLLPFTRIKVSVMRRDTVVLWTFI
jgi:hypothetical protein